MKDQGRAVARRRFKSIDGLGGASGEWVEPAAGAHANVCGGDVPLIGRGGGVCFVAASFGEGVRSVSLGRQREVLDIDADGRRMTVQAGISLAELYRVTVPRGLYLPPMPGHPQITVGGCIASNVHGKNPAADGTFADWVERVELFHPDHGCLEVSRAREPELFDLTCGGMGLTGIILRATLRLRPLPSPWVSVRKRAIAGLREGAELLRQARASSDLAYTWNDLTVFDERIGRGYLTQAVFEPTGRPALRDPDRFPRHDPSRRSDSMPRLFHPWLVPWIARIHRFQELRQPQGLVELYDFVFPGMGFRSANYYAMYGKAGMIAHMPLVADGAVDLYLDALVRVLRVHRVPILISAMKRFAGRQRLLRFSGDGTSLHLHIPNDAAGRRLADDLAGLAQEFQAIRAVYVESRLTAAEARALYPEFEEFRAGLRRFDPKRRFQSDLSRRLDL